MRAIWSWLLKLWSLALGVLRLRGAPPFMDTTVMGVRNLTMVAPRLWRMGQPTDAASWAYVAKTIVGFGGLHPGQSVTVVKLNDDNEGSDEPVLSIGGWRLVKMPIPPKDDEPWTVLVKPDPKIVWGVVQLIVDAYTRGETVVWHCTAGRDRTSLISALVGMKLLGWSKSAAWRDMLAHGFRWELPDLDLFFVEVAAH